MKNRATTLPTTSEERKKFPLASGVLDYFPDAIVALARLSQQGNDQHNPGKPLFWDRPKSSDHADTLMRHFVERGTIDTDGQRHSAKVAWRALAILQLELEAAQEKEIKTSGGKVPIVPFVNEFKIGDRVRFIWEFQKSLFGRTGTVIGFEKPKGLKNTYLVVQFDHLNTQTGGWLPDRYEYAYKNVKTYDPVNRRTGVEDRRLNSYNYSYNYTTMAGYTGPFRRANVGRATQVWGRRTGDKKPQ